MNLPCRSLLNISRLIDRWRTPSTMLWAGLLLATAMLLGSGGIALAVIAPDVANTRHNLSASNAATAIAGSSFGTAVKAESETQICVFCHTPHAAEAGIVAPLWNRSLSASEASYTFYSSSSIDAYSLSGVPAMPPTAAGIGSKLCLSCHDGTLAIGTVGVLNNTKDAPINMQGTNPAGPTGFMPDGRDGLLANTGFTRKIGINLSNDHPISFTYNTDQANNDGELYKPGIDKDVNGAYAVAGRVPGQPKPQFPLITPVGSTDITSGQMECITCHDPHLKSDELDPVTLEPIDNKFLRGNRFQLVTPTPGTTNNYDPTKDIICLACHNKPTWATSTHSNIFATSERYKSSASDLRDFPRNISTWQAACANCHDMHTVPGARRLLREAVDSPGTLSTPKSAGNSAIEQVCFQCHSPDADRVLVKESPDQVPDIKTDFSLPIHMPIVTAEQGNVPQGGGSTGNTSEAHDIGVKANNSPDTDYGSSNIQRGKDFIETRTLMGVGNLANRHAECTDCHQPHRVTRTVLFNGDPTIPAEKGSHRHAGSNDVGGVPHNNLASGSQRGQFGVEPQYGSNNFYDEPISFIEKRGAVPTGASDLVTSTWLTREYQVCAKCHSNYAFGPLQGSIANPGNIPSLGRTGGTPSGANGMRFYTNIFREIQAPEAHRGNATPGDSGAYSGRPPYSVTMPNVNFRTENRRSWHPVMGPTGRTPDKRGNLTPTNWLPPWNADIGIQTMYCTDCHGSETPPGLSKHPVDGSPEGPHGSNNIFLLKGWWDQCTGIDSNLQGCLNDPLTSSATVVKNSALNPAVIRPGASASTQNDLCFKCHDYSVYGAGANSNTAKSGFSGTSWVNGHKHRTMTGTIRCMWCHVAVPHGWKNKALLVNLNDVGREATCRQEDADDAPDGYKCTETVGLGNPMAEGTQVRNGPPSGSGLDPATWAAKGYSNPPYYRNAILKIASFAASGDWKSSNCGSTGSPGNGLVGECGGWMGSNEGCTGLP